jgi:hypothetical protein
MKQKLTVIAVIALVFAFSTPKVNAHWEFHDVYGQYLFGYTGVEDTRPRNQDEITANGIMTNVTTIASCPNTNITATINYFNSKQVKAALFLDNVLFIEAGTTPRCNESSPIWRLRQDYQAKFDSWYNTNKAYLTPQRVALLIINSEANNRGLPSSVLDQATAYVKTKLPTIPTVVGYGLTQGATNATAPLPVEPAGFVFWSYAVEYPANPGTLFQYWLNFFKQNISMQQRLIIVFDAHHQPLHTSKGINQVALGPMARRYANLVRSEPLIVGMIGFTWQSFGDHIGMRSLHPNVRVENQTASCILLC